MAPPPDPNEFIRQALRDLFMALLLLGWDDVEVRQIAETEAESTVGMYHRDYPERKVS